MNALSCVSEFKPFPYSLYYVLHSPGITDRMADIDLFLFFPKQLIQSNQQHVLKMVSFLLHVILAPLSKISSATPYSLFYLALLSFSLFIHLQNQCKPILIICTVILTSVCSTNFCALSHSQACCTVSQ